jgi:hypothetical protein
MEMVAAGLMKLRKNHAVLASAITVSAAQGSLLVR